MTSHRGSAADEIAVATGISSGSDRAEATLDGVSSGTFVKLPNAHRPG